MASFFSAIVGLMKTHRGQMIIAFLTALAFSGEVRIPREALSTASAEESENDTEKKLAFERKERYSKWMREYAEGTQIELIHETPVNDRDRNPVELMPNPVLRYSDEEHRIPDATLWVWTSEGRPVAFQKVEGNNHGGGQQWTICFVSLSQSLVKVKWPMGRPYTSLEPGIRFRSIQDGEIPSDIPRLRTVQIKEIKEQFTGRFDVTPDGAGGSEARILPKPLFEYSDPVTKTPLGAIFGMSSTGTNPGALLLIEARPDRMGKLKWHYGFAKMSSSSAQAFRNNIEVWAEPGASKQENDKWTYFFLRRDFP